MLTNSRQTAWCIVGLQFHAMNQCSDLPAWPTSMTYQHVTLMFWMTPTLTLCVQRTPPTLPKAIGSSWALTPWNSPPLGPIPPWSLNHDLYFNLTAKAWRRWCYGLLILVWAKGYKVMTCCHGSLPRGSLNDKACRRRSHRLLILAWAKDIK